MDGSSYSTVEIRERAVQAVLNGMPVVQVAQAYQTDRTTIQRWLRRYREAEGFSGLIRRPVSGRPRKLNSLSESRLKSIVLAPASNFGFETDLWTSARLRLVLNSNFEESVSEDTVWRRLREAGLTWQAPEREYVEADPELRNEWLHLTLPRIREAVKEHRAILYCQDEASVSLTPLLGRTWAERGKPRKISVSGARGSISALSAISPTGRLLFRLHEKRIRSQEVIDFLEQMLRHHARRHLVVVMDQAPPHTSKKTLAYIASQPRLHVFHLPPYSPDWNPDEKVWNHLKNHELKAHGAQNKGELLDLTGERLERMSNNSDLLHGLYFRCCVAELLR